MHTGSVSIRVPADMLDQAVLEIRALSLRVQYESSDSRDVTDEYVDLSSRLKNTMATEEALLKLLERAEKVDDALAVQSNLSRVQEDVERLQGRIKYLEQTSAYSLLNVSLSEEPREMVPDAGPDVRAGVGEPVRFRATFTPPDGIESFDYTWDFGDGTQVVSGNRTAPTGDGTRRVTATVHHRYEDERDSPYIVQFNITGIRRRRSLGGRGHSDRHRVEDPEHRGLRRGVDGSGGGRDGGALGLLHQARRHDGHEVHLGLRRRVEPGDG